MDHTSRHGATTSQSPASTSQPPGPPVPPPPAPHRRRHTRYSDTAAAVLQPPHVIINTRRRRSPHHRAPQTAMSTSPPAVAGPSSQTPVVATQATPQPPPPQGQDHDRMETDDDDDSDSDSELDDGEIQPEPEQAQAHESNGAESTPHVEDVAMDLAPDIPIVPGDPPAPPTTASQASQTTIATVHVGVNTSVGTGPIDGPSTPPPRIPWEEGSLHVQPQIHIAVGDAMMDSGILRQEISEADRAAQLAALTEQDRQVSRRQREEDDDDDGRSDSDDSMDEPDHPYWAHFKPDTSLPDESELSAIEEASEINATNHEHWEKQTFEALDDPEYVPSDVGRINWTVNGHHGTPENPNREEIMRSPSVLIGGLYWNVKYYPRGNDGTDYLSVYIECSPKPYEENVREEESDSKPKVEEKIPVDDSTPVAEAPSSSTESPNEDSGNAMPAYRAPTSNAVDEVAVPVVSETPEVDMTSSHILPDKTITEAELAFEKDPPWAAAAQIACVIYNPDEPRVFATQSSKHQYYNENSDWGWTRFHGPWSEIHNRRRYQRKPLLQNDTLAFTVYIQVVRDHTKSLWWHPSDSQPNWDSMSILGVRGLKSKETHSSAIVAALSAWIHLGSLVESIHSVNVPNRFTKAGQKLQPLLKEFQAILLREGLQSKSSDVSLTPLASIMGYFYGTEMDSKKDVILVWKGLRRLLNFEANECHDAKNDLFGGCLLLMQPDPFNPDISNHSESKFPAHPKLVGPELALEHEPASVQETIHLAFQYRNKAFRLWENASEGTEAPAVLQIELHRQSYREDARKWKKLTHKISMNETIDCSGHQYTLYGMIVHRGGLDYSEFFSVLRPEGPGTRWLKYAGDNTSRAVEVLTTKQAVTDHEGGGTEESAAVAYVAIYVRTDQLSRVLSPESRKETLRNAQKAQETTASDSDQAKTPKSTPFRVGKRDWCVAFPTESVYDAIRDCHGSHLSRSFYRTEYKPEMLQRIEDSQMTEAEPETKEKPPPSEKGQIESQREGQAAAEPAKAEESQKAAPKDPLSRQINVFVKKFDTENQEIVDFGMIKANGATVVIDHLRKELEIPKDEEWDFYHEHTLTIKSKHAIKRSSMFFDLSYGDEPWDGMLIIAQRRPTKEEIKALEEKGKAVTPVEKSIHLLGDHNPSFYASYIINSFFTRDYLSAPLACGRTHGPGTLVTLSGSSYQGPFRCGSKAGPKGTMRYANGDTYTGDWLAGEPDGQGTMTYAKTGNVYTGGWRKRRRFGKGIMEYKVADEEMQLCGVCYERDMDAVFCYCGHVVACEECAKRLDVCPVCRETVKRVVLLKGATGGSGAVKEWGGGVEGGGGVGIIP